MAGVLKSLLLLLLVLSGTAPHAQEEDSPDFLVTEIQSRLSEHARLEPMVMDASGDVRLLLERRLAEKEREILEAVDALVAELGEQPDPEARAAATSWMNEFAPVAVERTEARHQALMALVGQAAPEGSAEALELETNIRRALQELVAWYRVLDRVAVNQQALGLDDSEVHGHLVDQLPELAEMLASAIELAIDRIEEVRFKLSLLPNDEEFQRQLNIMQLQLDSSAQNLSRVSDLLERLELDTADYQSLVIQVTGELSSDVFSLEVIEALLDQWAYDSRKWLGTNGANFAFKLLLFLLIIAASLVASRLVGRLVRRAVNRFRVSRLLGNVIVALTANLVLALGFLLALSQLGVSLGPVLAGLGVLGFIVGFALQDTLGNFASGMMILLYRPFDEGDLVEVAGGVMGEVHQMSLVSSVILTPDNQRLVVPNNRIWGNVIRNINAQGTRRVDLLFSLAYQDDIERAEALFQQLLDTHPKVLEQPASQVRVHQLADSAVMFAVRPWVNSADYWEVYWDLHRSVKLGFAEAGLSIPFPQRDVHLVGTLPSS